MMCVLAFYRGNTLKKTEKDVSRDRKNRSESVKIRVSGTFINF